MPGFDNINKALGGSVLLEIKVTVPAINSLSGVQVENRKLKNFEEKDFVCVGIRLSFMIYDDKRRRAVASCRLPGQRGVRLPASLAA